MNEDHIKVTFSEPKPTRVLLEEDLGALETISDILTHYAKVQPGDPVHYTDRTRAVFLNVAQTLRDRVKERSIDYNGRKYIIMAKGRRKLSLGLKREPDIYIGSDWGLNFIEACQSYFVISSYHRGYNQRRNTYCGRFLFGLPVRDVNDYESGIKTTEKGYAVWFKLCNQTYTLIPEEVKGDAELLHKMLNRTFENLITIKNTKSK